MTSTTPIQLFVPHFRTDEVLEQVRECLERGWTGLGFKTVEIEDAWKDYTGLSHAHFLNSATAALHIAFELLKEQGGWADGDEVITTPMTFVSTNHAILYAGLNPVFADVDEHLCLDPASVRERITDRTRAVVFVGIGGNTGRLAEVAELCRERGIKLVLDAAHMSGTRLTDGRDPGHLADVTCYSFQAVKNLPTADSGMICFQDASLDAAARKFSWLGISKDTYARAQKGTYSWLYDVDYVGYKYNGSALMAGMALVALKYLDEDNAYRRQLSAWYDEELADVAAVGRVPMSADCVPSRHLYQILLDDRDGLMGHLNAAQIFPGVHYRDNTEYSMYSEAKGTCPRSMAASERLMSLPMHLGLSREDVARVGQEIRAFVGA